MLPLTTKNRRHFAPFCPCGKSNGNGKFCPYEIGGQPSAEYGYCHACGQTFKPSGPRPEAWEAPPPPPRVFAARDFAQITLQCYGKNALHAWMSALLGRDLSVEFARNFVGTAKDGSAVFWYVDERMRYTGCKKVAYAALTGKRYKDRPGSIYHPLKAKDGYQACLFGQWQLTGAPGQEVNVVESEKTALLMKILNPGQTWLATCGATAMTPAKGAVLKGLSVTLWPDAHAPGRKAFAAYAAKGWGILKDPAPHRHDGADLADLFSEKSEK